MSSDARARFNAKKLSDEDCETCDALGAVQSMQKKSGSGRGANPARQDRPSPSGAAMPEAPDNDVLGQSAWTVLHSVAAYYPETNPSEEKKRATREFISLVPKVYPCRTCADDFADIMKEMPLSPAAISSSQEGSGASTGTADPLASREALVRWMCDAHNKVNEHLGKPQFDCALADQRWRRKWH